MKPLPRTDEDTVEVHREEPKFGRARGELICDTRISDGAVRLYLYLQWRAGQKNTNRRARKTMAAELGISPQAIRTRAIELVYYGWLAIVERYTEDGDRTSNGYHVFDNRALSKMWRDGYKDTETEKLQPFPTNYEPRKSRAGIGGRPKKAVVEGETSLGVQNSSFVPSETQVSTNQLSSNPVQEIAASAAPTAKAGSYQERTGKTDAECEAERISEAEKQLALDLWRMNMHEQIALLEKAVKHYFGYGGSLATKYARMFYGVFKGGKKQKADDSVYAEQTALLKDAPVTANEFTEWAAEYCKTRGIEPNAKDMVRDPEKVVSYILARRDRIAAKSTPAIVHIAPEPDPAYQPTPADAEYLRSEREKMFGGKAAS
jgi:hypothetical protein